MPTTDDYIYFFLHIPKCAGTSLSENIRYGMPPSEFLFVSPTPANGFDTQGEVDGYLTSLSPDQKRRVRVVLGHSVYYGMHRHFDRPARYITFLRSPASQARSMYSYVKANFDLIKRGDSDGKLPDTSDELTFAGWCQRFDPNVQIATLLNYQLDRRDGQDEPDGRNGRTGLWNETPITQEHLDRARRILDDFYFVGMTETMDEEALFFLHQIGCHRVLTHRLNAANQSEDVSESALESAVPLDAQLYEHGKVLNARFKSGEVEYQTAVDFMHANADRFMPLRLRVKDVLSRAFGASISFFLMKRLGRRPPDAGA